MTNHEEASTTATTTAPTQAVQHVPFEKLLSARQAADVLEVHEKTLKRWARTGVVPAVRLGGSWRFRVSQLDTWLRGQVRSAAAQKVGSNATL